jgi:hypothetical protein
MAGTQSQFLGPSMWVNVTTTSTIRTICNQKLLGTYTVKRISLSGVGLDPPTLELDRKERVAALFTKDYICPRKSVRLQDSMRKSTCKHQFA